MIKLAIVGYGNLGKGVEAAVSQNPDMELVAVFTRRDPAAVTLQTPGVPVLPLAALEAIGFRGYLTIEREVGADPAKDIAQAANFLRNLMK